MTVLDTPTLDEALRAVVVDDHRLLVESLSLALRLEGVSCTVPALVDTRSLLEAVVSVRPHVVLLDLDLGGSIGDGSELVAPLVAAGCRVLVVTGTHDLDRVSRALELGATGVVRKDVGFSTLLDTTLAVARGEEVLDPDVRHRLVTEARRRRQQRAGELAPFRKLSPREAEVLRALAAGRSVGAIATSWFVSEATVRSQVRSILLKLDVSSQLAAIAQAHSSGWLRSEVAQG